MRLALFMLLAAQSGGGDPPPAPAASSFAAPTPSAAPTSPLASATSSAWACTRQTLLTDAPCTIEGKTQAQAASKEQTKENQRQAQVIADELCGAVARGRDAEPDPTLQALCKARIQVATRKCGGDGTRRLVDDAGRFNPGHAKCYAALGELVREIEAVRGAAGDCCTCLERACNVSESQCIERHAAGKALDAPAACVEGVCAADCAALRLVRPQAAPPSSRKQ